MTRQGSSCGACKFLRRKCISHCAFAPYFCYDEAETHFAAVHKVFGASNVSKLLLHLPVYYRGDAAITISYEALARMRDPVYGCIAHIFELQQQVVYLQEEIEMLENQMADYLRVGIASCGSAQLTSNPNSEIQFSSQQDAMSSEYYGQDQLASVLHHSEYAAGNHSLDSSQMNVQLSPLFGWEDQAPHVGSHPNSLEKLLEEVDRDIFTYCSLMDSTNCIN